MKKDITQETGLTLAGNHRTEYLEHTQTLIGTQRKNLQDLDTGEVITVDQIKKQVYGTKNFWKCYLMDFLTVLGIIDSKQLDIFVYICENTNPSNNIFLGTYKKIAEDCKCSSATIAKIMTKLQDAHFLKKIQNGAWLINPNILMKGNDHKRQILLSYYETDEPINRITYSRRRRKKIEDNPDQQKIPEFEEDYITREAIESSEEEQNT